MVIGWYAGNGKCTLFSKHECEVKLNDSVFVLFVCLLACQKEPACWSWLLALLAYACTFFRRNHFDHRLIRRLWEMYDIFETVELNASLYQCVFVCLLVQKNQHSLCGGFKATIVGFLSVGLYKQNVGETITIFLKRRSDVKLFWFCVCFVCLLVRLFVKKNQHALCEGFKDTIFDFLSVCSNTQIM